MHPYIDFPNYDESNISLQYFSTLEEIPYVSDNKSVVLHQHDYYEFVFIEKGTCHHVYKGINIPLMSGDTFMIPPNEPHSYLFQGNISICNCQFYPDKINRKWRELIKDIDYVELQKSTRSRMVADGFDALTAEETVPSSTYGADINGQGIIHLNSEEASFILNLLKNIRDEQINHPYEFIEMKQILFEIILITIKRVKIRQFGSSGNQSGWKQQMIGDLLFKMESNIADSYNFEEIAESWNVSSNYFRKIFKNTTGLSPVDYLNRLRVLKALEYLQTSDLRISEVAANVGVLDQNYFSRLFKKILGVAPSYYKL
jgi:AraC-like DNA-binding protein